MHDTNPKSDKKPKFYEAFLTEEVINNDFLASSLPFFCRKVITLLDMKDFPAQLLVDAMYHLKNAKSLAEKYTLKGNGKSEIIRLADECISLFKRLEFLESAENLLHFRGQIENNMTAECAVLVLDTHITALATKIKHSRYFSIEPSKSNLYRNQNLASEQFAKLWPHANDELTHAGNCIALDEWTACVCHCMRACELIMKAFAKSVDAKVKINSTWGLYLDAIERERMIKLPNGKEEISPKWKSNKKLYEKLFTALGALKTNCRDEVFHAVRLYDDIQAGDVLNWTKQLAVACATELKEPE